MVHSKRSHRGGFVVVMMALLHSLLSCQGTHAWMMPASSALVSPRRSTLRLSMQIPILEEWKLLPNGEVIGTVKNHPSIDDGDVVTTSPLANPDQAAARAIVTTMSGSKYKLGTPVALLSPKTNKVNGKVEPAVKTIAKSNAQYNLNGKAVGSYLLSGNPQRSTSGKSQIWTAYRTDIDGQVSITGGPVTVKISPSRDKMKRESDNYKKLASGVLQGRFVKCYEFFPQAGVTKQFSSQSALVMERGDVSLKDYIRQIGTGLEGRQLRDAAAAGAQCLQALHAANLIWTDLKLENFVVIGQDGEGSGRNTGKMVVKGIDLESAMPVRDNPIDYSPEACPPEFAKVLLQGKAPYFVLDYSYDIWSYGIFLYEISTGRSAFEGKNPSQITKLLVLPDYEVDVAAVPEPKLRDLIVQCLRTNPKQRPSVTQILLHPYFLTTGVGPFSF